VYKMVDESLEKSLRRLPRFVGLINQRCGNWVGARSQLVWWDRYNNVFVAGRESQTSAGILGPLWVRAGRNVSRAVDLGRNQRQLRRWSGPFELGLCVPPDTVIVRPFLGRGPIVASQSAGRVLKLLVRNKYGGCKLDDEVLALRIGRENALTERMQTLLDDGEEDRIRWMESDFVPNSKPFIQSSGRFFTKRWYRFLSTEVIPFLTEYYSVAGIRVLDYADLLEGAFSRCDSDDRLRIFLPYLEWVSRQCPPTTANLLEAQVHGDLSSAHVHRTRREWKLIDWGESHRRPVIYEFFRGPWDHPSSTKPRNIAFWKWLSDGNTGLANGAIQERVKLTDELYRELGANGIDQREMRYAILIVMMDELTKYFSTQPDENFDCVVSASGQPATSREKYNVYKGKLAWFGGDRDE
jgi:hypothetical protein